MFYLNTVSRAYVKSSFLLLASILILTQISFAAEVNNTQNVGSSTVTGMVFDPNRNPLPQIDVELANVGVGGATFLRTKTDDTGRYQFNNIPDGRYKITVMPFRYNLLDQSIELRVDTVSFSPGGGAGFFTQDFYLKPRAGGLGDTTTGVIFSQDVPKEAERLYKEANEDLSDNKNSEAIRKLVGALKIFPSYYAASQRLGIELLKKEQYGEAFKIFMRAAEANPKSSRSFYYAGFALNKLGKDYNKAALKSLEKAYILAPASWEVAFLIGKIEREEGNYNEAERHLLKAKKLSDKKVPEIHKELAQLYGNDLKKYDKAADELEQYMKASGKKDEGMKKIIADLRSKSKNNN